MKLNFRNLKEKEIKCLPEIEGHSIHLLLHSTAFACTQLLNEAVGPMNWECAFSNNNKNCTVRIWDETKNLWVSKEDCGGALTGTDGLKAQASNGFKRACMKWGLGLEIKSQPNIYIPLNRDNSKEQGGIVALTETYCVKDIEYDGKEISFLTVANSAGAIVYVYGEPLSSEDKPVVEVKSEVKVVDLVPEEFTMKDVMEDVAEDNNSETPLSTTDVPEFSVPEESEKVEDAVEAKPEVHEEAVPEFVIPETEASEPIFTPDVPVEDRGKDDDIPELEDYSDGFDEIEEKLEMDLPFAEPPIDYIKEIEEELRRTKISRKGTLSFYKVKTFEDMNAEQLKDCLQKLREKPSYNK